MLDAALKTLHVMSVIVWIGGMAFTQFFLRPSLPVLEPPARLALMTAVVGRFFRVVAVIAPLAWLTGGWMVARAAAAATASGGAFHMPVSWMLMAAGGTAMVAVFAWLRLGPYRALARSLNAGNLPAASAALARVRQGVALNLGIGTVVVLVTLMRWP